MSTLVQHNQSLHRRQYHHPLQRNSLLANSDSIASSSHASTQDWVAAYSTPIPSAHPDFDFASSASYVPSEQRSLYDFSSSTEQQQQQQHQQNINNLRVQVQTPFGSSHDSELMQSDHSVPPSTWNFSNGQLTPTSARSHYRESSLSSMGSAGPPSPYTSSTSHPHVILPSDSVGEQQYYDGLPIVDHSTYQAYSKPLTPSPHTPSHDGGPSGSHYLASSAFHHAAFNPHAYHDSNYAHMMAMQKHHPSGIDSPSVASTHESPATPAAGDDYDEQSRKAGEPASRTADRWVDGSLPVFGLADFRSASSMPKLDRTMSDAYNDELYNPNLVFAAPSTKPTDAKMLSRGPHSDVFSQRLQAANSQHLSASTQLPLVDQSRGRSPFRQGSPLAPTSNSFGSPQSLGSAAKMREAQKAQNDARVLREQLARNSPGQTTPKTISPKDALLDYHETEEDSAMPLFPPQKAPQFRLQQSNHSNIDQSQPDFEDATSQQSYGSMATSRRESSSAYSATSQATQHPSGFTFAPPSVPGGLSIPQQYPFVPQRRQASNLSSFAERTPEFPATLTSMESSSSEYAAEAQDVKKPAGATADGGTYTCTYHGCTLRFETPAKLQKHKREGHRSSQPLMGGASTNPADRNSQAGPHTCHRVNPSTGKPCNVVFSRPYDLTRHEDTIHNARKQKVRCHLCTEDKQFSRNDALTRHMRVVHPEVDFPGKTRRRAQHD